MYILKRLLVGLLCLLSVNIVFAQSSQQTGANRENAGTQPLQQFNAPYRLAPGDVVSVKVFGEPDVSIDSMRVPLSGVYNYPLIGEIKLTGETVNSLATLIKDKLNAGFLADPKVSVNIVNYRPVIVTGAVEEAGAVEYQEGMTLRILSALKQLNIDSLEMEKISIQRNSRFFHPAALDALILPGDIVSYDEAEIIRDVYYIYGEVGRAGKYPYEPGLTIEKAIIVAGGYSPFASKRNILVRRDSSEDTFKAKLYDEVKAGDVITVKKRWF